MHPLILNPSFIKMKTLTTILLLSFISLGVAQSYKCTTAGRFRYRDPTCRNYYLCVLYNEAYVKSNYTCPSTMIFESASQTCSANAKCIETVCDNLPERPLYPKLANQNDPTCRTYIQCVGSSTDRYPVIGTCPDGLFFNELLIAGPDCWPQGNCA